MFLESKLSVNTYFRKTCSGAGKNEKYVIITLQFCEGWDLKKILTIDKYLYNLKHNYVYTYIVKLVGKYGIYYWGGMTNVA